MFLHDKPPLLRGVRSRRNYYIIVATTVSRQEILVSIEIKRWRVYDTRQNAMNVFHYEKQTPTTQGVVYIATPPRVLYTLVIIALFVVIVKMFLQHDAILFL